MQVVAALRTLTGDPAELLGAVLVANPDTKDLGPGVPFGLGGQFAADGRPAQVKGRHPCRGKGHQVAQDRRIRVEYVRPQRLQCLEDSLRVRGGGDELHGVEARHA